MKRAFFAIITFILLIEMTGLPLAQTPPLQKVLLKIEGVHKKSSVKKIHAALLSVPGVKKAEFRIEKKWIFFNDYEKMVVVVEFEHGMLNSETLINVVEGISDRKNIYKVKFIE